MTVRNTPTESGTILRQEAHDLHFDVPRSSAFDWIIINYRVVKGGGPRGGGSLIFRNIPQSSQTESSGFPSYLLPLDTPGPLRTL